MNLHETLERALELLAGVLEGARYERRDGYTFLAFPTFAVRDLNGMWVESDAAAAHVETARAEALELGTPFNIMVREGRSRAVERTAVELGFEPTVRIPGMAVRRETLQPATLRNAEVLRVDDDDGVARALGVAAAGFGMPPEVAAAVYAREVAALDGLDYYLVCADGIDVATATGFTVGDGTAIYSVATHPDYRGRGYGSAVTTQAVRGGFAAGASFAALQSSALGESVYRRLGFSTVETYVLYTPSRKS